MFAIIPDNNKILELIDFQKSYIKNLCKNDYKITILRNYQLLIDITNISCDCENVKEIAKKIKSVCVQKPFYDSKNHSISAKVNICFKQTDKKTTLKVVKKSGDESIKDNNYFSELKLFYILEKNNCENIKNPLENIINQIIYQNDLPLFPMDIKIFKVAEYSDLSQNYSKNVCCTKIENFVWAKLN